MESTLYEPPPGELGPVSESTTNNTKLKIIIDITKLFDIYFIWEQDLKNLVSLN